MVPKCIVPSWSYTALKDEVVSEARELMTSNDKSRSHREISLKWD